jgi:hypothetical protein
VDINSGDIMNMPNNDSSCARKLSETVDGIKAKINSLRSHHEINANSIIDSLKLPVVLEVPPSACSCHTNSLPASQERSMSLRLVILKS